MKKLIALGAVAGALFMTSCEPTGSAMEPATYPGDSLTVSPNAKPLVIETTGTWCQYCPNGAEIMAIIDGVLGDSVVLIGNHVNDWFSQNANVTSYFDDNFPTSGVPNFYVNNEDVGQNPTAAAGAATLAEVAFGVNADVVKDSSGSKLMVYPRVKVLETKLDETYMIQSYLMISGVEARDHGNGVDLNQVSSVPLVTTGSGATPSVWAQDAAQVGDIYLIKQGTIYTHDHTLFGNASNAVLGWYESDDATTRDTSHVSLGPWGINLGDINPLGNSFAAGDIYGTRYNPFHLEIELPALPFEADLSVATIIWQLRQDGSGDYDYVNGSVNHVH